MLPVGSYPGPNRCCACPLCCFGPACVWRICSNATGCRILLPLESSDYYARAGREGKEFNGSTTVFAKEAKFCCSVWKVRCCRRRRRRWAVRFVRDEWKCCLFLKRIEFEMALLSLHNILESVAAFWGVFFFSSLTSSWYLWYLSREWLWNCIWRAALNHSHLVLALHPKQNGFQGRDQVGEDII